VNNGGGFVIFKTLANAGQTLQVDRARGWVLAKGGTIDGGTVATSGAGYLEVPYGSRGTLNNVILNGNVRIDGDLYITGASGGNGTVTINNPEAIEGSGNVFAATLPAGITVRGGISTQFDGQFGGERATVHVNTNQGRIRAQKSIFNDAGRLRLLGDDDTITNAGALELSPGGTLTSLSNLTFASGGKLTIDGGGLLEVTGNLNLSTTFDSLDVKPRTNGQAYGDVIATYTGTLTGVFSSVTPGINVQYLTASKQIRISGTPVPEPAGFGLLMVMLGGLACRRHRRLRG
jgi:hypothetical protein